MVAVSLVEVSVSIDTQLNVLLMTRRKMTLSFSLDTSASVNIMVMRVAMLGSIIPTPLATPTMRALLPAIVASAILCTVSVVMIP